MTAHFDWKGDGKAERIVEAVKGALLIGGEKILSKAVNEEVPWATGVLGGSGYTEERDKGCLIIFNTPYAHYQHERVLRHPDPRNPLSQSGRKDHYLRDPLYELKDEIVQDCRDAVGDTV